MFLTLMLNFMLIRYYLLFDPQTYFIYIYIYNFRLQKLKI